MKLTRTFTKGIMNKDLDERLIPPGVYRDGQNIGVSTSEDSNVGSIENMLGNTQVGGDLSYLSASAKTIGAIANPSSEEFYWFVTDTNFDYIIRYNEPSNSAAVILKDTKGRVLKFDSEHVITGINIIGDLLFWTDNLNPPRRVNILRYYELDDFTEDDISVIVKPPLDPPSILLQDTDELNVTVPSLLDNVVNNISDKYIRFAFRWRYENNEFSALSPFSSTAFRPTDFSMNYAEGVFTSMTNGFNQVQVALTTGDSQVKDIQLLYFDEFTGSVYIVETFDKEKNNWADNTTENVLFNNNKIFAILSNDEVTRLFDNVPRKAKSQEIIGSRLIYGNYVQGYDLKNQWGENLAIDFTLSLESKETSQVGTPSFHSDRDYEVGIVYLDDYGRMSTVLTPNVSNPQGDSDSNTLYIPPANSDTINDLRVSINHSPPEFASKYRIYIKQGKSDNYATIFPVIFYRDGTDFYFFIQRPEVNKVDVGSFIYMKNINGIATNSSQQFRVLEVEVKEEDFLGGSEFPGLYFKISDNRGALSIDQYEGEWDGSGTTGDYGDGKKSNVFSYIQTDRVYPGTDGTPNVGVAQIDFPHYYGASLTNNRVKLHTGPTSALTGKPTPHDTSAERDARIKITITLNGTFKVENFSNGIYELWYDNLLISDYYSTPYHIDNPPLISGATPPTPAYNLNMYIIFPDGPGYTLFDYWTFNVHSSFGVNNFQVTTAQTGVSSGNLSDGSNIQFPQLSCAIAPASAGAGTTGVDAFQNQPGDLNKYPNGNIKYPSTDKAIKAGAIIEVKVEEDTLKQGVIYTSSINDNFYFASADYDNIEEWFYEDNIWQSFTHLNSDDKTINHRGSRIFFRRVYADVKYFEQLGDSTVLTDQSIFIQSKSSGNPTGNNQGNYPTYAKRNSYDGSLVMFIRSSEVIDQTGEGTNTTVVAGLKIKDLSVRFRVAQSENGTPIFETKPTAVDTGIFYETPYTFNIDKVNKLHESNLQNQTNTVPAIVSLNPNIKDNPTLQEQQNAAFNCFTFGNGVEATRIKGQWNEAYLINSPRASTDIEEYGEEHLEASLTYSGVYVENTNVNNLNEFNLSLANFKDVNKEYGPIQKLHSRDTDVVLFQEDKVSKVLYGKNLLSDAVGGGSVASIPQVLGTQITYSGEYGISENPESFATWGNNMYFADAKRGAILQLGLNGIFEISQLGMSDYFKDLFRANLTTQKLGAIDPFKEQYVLSSNTTPAPPCDFSFTPRFTPQIGKSGVTSTLEIVSSQSWTLSLVDTGDGTNWVTMNGITPSYGNSRSEIVTFKFLANTSTSNRAVTLNIAGCDGVVTSQIFTQSGQQVLTTGVLAAGDTGGKVTKGSSTGLQTGSVTYDFSSNTGSSFQAIDQRMVENSEVFFSANETGIEGFGINPTTGDDVTLKASQVGATNRASFAPSLGTKMYYLLTNTVYLQNQINEVIADSATVEMTPVLSGDEWTGTLPSLNRTGFDHLYMVIDYRGKVSSGSTAQFAVPEATNNVAGVAKGRLDFGNKEGRISLAYTPVSGAGATGNIFRLKQNGVTVATSGDAATKIPGTIDFVRSNKEIIYDIEVEHFGEGAAPATNTIASITVPEPTLTQFVYENSESVLDTTRPNYVCRADAMPTTTKYHNGASALPEEGDILYENPFGTSRLGDNAYHRYGNIASPLNYYLFVSGDGVVNETSVCTTCTETTVPVITIPSAINVIQGQAVDINLQTTKNPTYYNVIGTCNNIQVTAGAAGATISWTDCQNIANNTSIAANNTITIQTAGSYTTTSGTTTSVNGGVFYSDQLPQGLTFNQATGKFSGTARNTGTFTIEVNAENCFGTSSNVTITISVLEQGQRTFTMDGDQFGTTSTDACAINSGHLNPTLFYHSGSTTYPKVNDVVTVPVLGKGGTSETQIFRGGYVWYKAPWDTAGAGNGTALLIDDRGVIVEIVTC